MSPRDGADRPPSDQVLARLMGLHPKIIDLVLDRVEDLLVRLDHPERRLPPVVHVAGTNGKGSVIAFLRAILEAAGYRVHAYTSPHLVRFHERIRLAGELIEEDWLAELLEECEQANGGRPITYFEITTCAAFLAFSRVPADILLLETGLGGRLDATNVVQRPLLTVLTPVSIDHTQYLGETLAKIAFEKAGILKPGVPAVSAPQPDEVAAVFDARAGELGAPLFRAPRDWQVTRSADAILFRDDRRELAANLPSLPGRHQAVNAGTALACLSHLEGFEIDDAAIHAGLSQAAWPARLQRLTRGPLVDALPADWELWLDGGHNAAAGAILAEHLADWRDRPLHLIYGMLNTKAAANFLRPLADLATDLQAVTIPGEPASLSADEAAAHARGCGIEATAAESVDSAIQTIAKGGPARVLICGSLYLAGRVLLDND